MAVIIGYHQFTFTQHTHIKSSPPMVLSWYSWNWPLTKRRTRLDLPTADSPSKTSLNWQILFPAMVAPLVRAGPPRPAMPTGRPRKGEVWLGYTRCSSRSQNLAHRSSVQERTRKVRKDGRLRGGHQDQEQRDTDGRMIVSEEAKL